MKGATGKKHEVAILALEGFVPFDLSIPSEMFPLVTLENGEHPYNVWFSGPAAQADSGGLTVRDVHPLEALEAAHTVVVPGMKNAENFSAPGVLEALRLVVANGKRLASICTGACLLAAAGVLDGLTATTHWMLLPGLAARYPLVSFERELLFVDNGAVLTSAGMASGIDLCLHMIRADYGALAADRCAEFLVAPLERGGGCTQRVRRAPAPGVDSVGFLLLWLQENLHRSVSVADMARQAHMSERTLSRHFFAQTGMTPMTWLAHARVRRAQSLLESTALGMEEVAMLTGFASAAVFRERFQRIVGVSPSAWRKTYAHSAR